MNLKIITKFNNDCKVYRYLPTIHTIIMHSDYYKYYSYYFLNLFKIRHKYCGQSHLNKQILIINNLEILDFYIKKN